MAFKNSAALSTWTYRAMYGAVKILSWIPIRTAQSVGRIFGRLMGRLLRRRVASSLENLRYVFGHAMPESELVALNQRIIGHFGRMIFEVPHILRLSPNNLDRYVTFQNEEVLIRALEKGKGAFILTGHFGNWELMSAATALRLGAKNAVVVRPADFEPADRLLTRLRSRFGTEIIPKRRAMKKLLSAEKENKVIGILLDQNVDWYEGVFVPFLGKPACTNKGLALAAARTGSPVVPMFSVRQPDGRYRIIFEDEVALDKTGDKIRDVENNTLKFTRIIEKYVKAYPDHWFWFHKRWKTKPYCTLDA
ncbi:MAG: hypothetical protein B5M55_07150 [Desulfococcus sp. 4484_242]|nr:MAG: hypothetical protein B5M55_07150 [Desulfococcus sp. 4484_242]